MAVMSAPEAKLKVQASAAWSRYPSVYEINTWVWLTDLSRKYNKAIDLSSVPSKEWGAIADYGFDSVWFMGVWQRSPMGIAVSNRNSGLLRDFLAALPDYTTADNVGSPYCVRGYEVDQHFGGPKALAIARRELAKRGMKLILDFVPNHVAHDHPWVAQHPEYFIRGTEEDRKNDPVSFAEVNGETFACGRDPFFPAWEDVLQLNAFSPGLRQAAINTLSDLAEQCDGVRCDMAMLLLNDIFARTWTHRAGPAPATEYWADVISATKRKSPNFLFIAEAYWDLEWRLQQLGFDFCYDKKLYDRLEHTSAEEIRLHLCADPAYQDKLIRFIENHDEPRAAASFTDAKQRAAAVTIATTPGAKLFHEGQFEGRKVRPPVFLRRRPDEPVNQELQQFYARLLHAVDHEIFREGEWSLCNRTGWPDNPSFLNLVTWTWKKASQRRLIVVNLSDSQSQALVQVPWADETKSWHLADLLSEGTFERDGVEMKSPGLYIDLPPWSCHFFDCVAKDGN